MLIDALLAQRAQLREEQTSVLKEMRCRIERKAVLAFSEADGREVLLYEGRAFLPPGADPKVGGELIYEGESHRIRQVKRHESTLMGYVEVRF